MIWLLRLYPRAWRQRYAAEVGEMLAGRAFSLRTAVDLIAGAIDTWLHPSATLAAAAAAAGPSSSSSEERTMLSRVLRLDCRGFYGEHISREDQWKAGMSTIIWTAVLTLAWMALHIRFHDDPRVDSLSLLPFIFSMIYSLRYTYLKGRPASVKVIFIGGSTLAVGLILLAAGFLAAMI